MTMHEAMRPLRPGTYRLRANDFLLLNRTGAFESHAKTELLGGEIFFMNAQHRPHGQVKMALYNALTKALAEAGSDLTVAVEVSVALSEHDVPEPDLTLTNQPSGEGLIPLASVAMLVEVADSSLKQDLGRKRRRYARAGVAEYWVADLGGRLIYQMAAPIGSEFTDRDEVAFGQSITAVTIPGLTIATTSL